MKRLIHNLWAVAAFMFATSAFAQTTLNTTVGSTNYTGTNSCGSGGSGTCFITFVVANNSGGAIYLDDVGQWTSTGNNNNSADLYYSSTSLSGSISGAFSTSSPPTGWTLASSGTVSGITSTGVNTVLSNMNFLIPANTTYRFSLVLSGSTSYSGTSSTIPTPNTFTASGVSLHVGNYQISGSNVGYGGSNNPRAFTGSITFSPAGPCVNPPYAGNATASPDTICAGGAFTLGIDSLTGGTGQTYQWQISSNGSSWSNITGANGSTHMANQSTPNYYRCIISCTASDTTTPVYVHVLSGITPPYSQNFDNIPAGSSSNPALPDCWNYVETNHGGAGYAYVYSNSTYANSGSQAIYAYTSTNYTYGDTMAIVSPLVEDMDSNYVQMEFYARARYSGTSYDEYIYVGTMSNPTDISTLSIIDTVHLAGNITYTYYAFQFDPALGYNGTDMHIAIVPSSNTTYDYIHIDDILIEEIPACPKPLYISASNVMSTTANVSWQSSGSNFYVEYGPCGFTQGTGNFDTVSTTSLMLTGLSPNTEYDVYVQNDCTGSGDGLSSWSQISSCFKTECAPQMTPLSEDFEGTSSGSSSNPSTPDCWKYTRSMNGGTGYGYTRNLSSYANSGSQFFYMYHSNTTDTTSLVSPAIDGITTTDKRVEFWARGYYSGTAYDEHVVVGTLSDPTDMSTFHAIDTVACSGTTYQYFNVYLDQANGYNGTDMYVGLAFWTGSSTYGYLLIDDITISNIPSCLPSTNVAIGTVTNTSADVSWTAGDGLKYQIEYGPTGFTQGTGSPIITGITNTSYTITGLIGNTCYDVYVRDSCATGYSPWFGPISFCTPCDPQSTPVSEDFEGLTAGGNTTDPNTPDCWNYWRNPTATYYGYSYASLGPNGSYHWRFYQFNDVDTVALISPAVADLSDGDKRVRFKNKSYYTSTSYQGIAMEVGTCPNPNDIRGGTVIDTVYGDYGQSYVNEFTVFLDTGSGYNGSDQYVFFRTLFKSSQWYAYNFVDDIVIDDIPSCLPPWNLAASNITSSGATIDWSTIQGTCFKLEYGPVGFTPGTGIGVSVSNITAPYTITGMNPATVYDVYVADCCDSTTFAGPITFQTNCLSQLSGSYTVGGATADFHTLDSALTVLTGCGVSGPVTFNLQGGTHAIGPKSLGSITGVNATNMVTIKGGGPAMDTILFGSTAVGFDFDGGGNFAFEDLTVEGALSGRTFWLHNATSNISFDNCHLRNSPSATTSTTGVIVGSSSATSNFGSGDNASDISLTDCKVVGGYCGVIIYGSSTTSMGSGVTVDNCEFEDVYYYALRFYYMEDIEVIDNMITGSSPVYGMYAYYWNDIKIERNHFIGTTSGMYSGYVNIYRSDTPTVTSTIKNNFFIGGGSYANYNYSARHLDYVHNSILGTGTYGAYFSATTSTTLPSYDVNMMNNIFVGGSNYSVYCYASNYQGLSADYNVYHTNGSNLAYWNGARTDLTALKNADLNNNQSSLSGDPGYLSNTDLHIIGTLPNDAGDNGYATDDIDGDTRPASGSTTVDIGADEYTPLNYDVTPVAITEPENLSCGDSNAVVSVVFANLGLMNATTVSATVNVTGATTATFTTTYTGSVGSLGTDTITVGTFNTAAGGTYNIEAIVTMSNDQDASNDTLFTSVTINDILPRTPLATQDTVCAGDYSMLYYPANTTGMSFQWLTTTGDTISDMDSLQVGPMGTNDTTFILDPVSSSEYIGPADNTIGAGANYTAMNHYLQFTVTQATTIISVDVYANGAGLVDVVIQDGSGTTLYTHTVPTTGSGLNTLVINQPLTPGTYRMGSTTTNNAGGLYRNSAGASYPYTSTDGSISITGNTFSASYYYFFYNWLVGAGGCPRPQGMITLYNGGALSAAFTPTVNAPTLVDLTVDFDASGSTGATTYDWNFGDGSPNGSGMNVSHSYTANGTYNVTLIVTGACGTDTITQMVNIQGIGIEESLIGQTLSLFPNPNDGKFRVEFDVDGLQNVELRVVSLLGQVIYDYKPGNISGTFTEDIDLGEQAAGVYILQIVTEDGTVSKRFTIRK